MGGVVKIEFKIISILLIFLLSMSFTACSNNKDSANLDINNESEKTQLSSDNNKSLEIEAYKAVLQNKAEFFSTDNNKDVYLNDFLSNEEIYGTVFKLTHFTVLDMDGDGIPEIVLELTVGNYVEFYEVLHYMNNKVIGYIQVLRGFGNLKTDGTVHYSNSAFNNGYRKLNFKTNACEDYILGYHNTDDNNGNPIRTYFIDDKPATEEAYNAFVKEQDEKKDVVWYEFSQENIETKITDSQTKPSTENNNIKQKTKKQEYKDKLDKIELGFKGLADKALTTKDMYDEACKEHKQWDDELNDIYAVLKVQLSPSDMKSLQNEELQWIKDRDSKAKKDASEAAGGTLEKVLYVGSLAQSTKERCYVLVDKYMK
ncbi:lysozyme inhibitor LprI family protein [Clostridium sp. YIM B02555]|uniref:lysozyme inhibitor LprI family protein n=1 Tax=Clostridium sp. YIM B02555 TaxID=2911968 RepID=UPI001EEF1EE4|nr:lysozyme inhibitor LprI family protein [Clostridium sp. YIM B02555]